MRNDRMLIILSLNELIYPGSAEKSFAPRSVAIFAISWPLPLISVIDTGVAPVRSWPTEDINGPLGTFHDRGKPISIWINGDAIISKALGRAIHLGRGCWRQSWR